MFESESSMCVSELSMFDVRIIYVCVSELSMCVSELSMFDVRVILEIYVCCNYLLLVLKIYV
jgi:hypothetical protein